jgi:hypothetical protein
MTPLPYRYEHACDGLVLCIQNACEVSEQEHPQTGTIPYYGHPINRALWMVRYVMGQARRLGLYPSTEQLERECQRSLAA